MAEQLSSEAGHEFPGIVSLTDAADVCDVWDLVLQAQAALTSEGKEPDAWRTCYEAELRERAIELEHGEEKEKVLGSIDLAGTDLITSLFRGFVVGASSDYDSESTLEIECPLNSTAETSSACYRNEGPRTP